jgi:hypothetical protein
MRRTDYGDETAPASPAAEAVRLWASGGCGGRGAKPGGAAVAAGAVRRLRNPFLPLIPKARYGVDRRGGPFCCCSCLPAFQDVVLKQAPRDGPHEAVRIWTSRFVFQFSLTYSGCFFFDPAILVGFLGFLASQDDERLQGGDGERRDEGILCRIQGAGRK